MLRKVIRPDKSGVSFKYDPFGRRIEKAVTRAGTEEVSELEGSMPSIEEGTWETVGGVRIRKPNTEMKKPHVVKGIDQSIYEEESRKTKEENEKAESIEKVIRFLWDGNTLLHEWKEENPANRMKSKSKVAYKADYLLKLEKQEEEKAGEEAEKGQKQPDSLVTWVFQDDFIPRGKITQDGNYSIISDYLGTPVEAYDEEGKKVWERELDIYGRVKTGRKDAYGRNEKETGEKNFIPFRFQGQYEDEETGLYYNRFRYYSPEDGCYTQQDPIGLAGGNPTLYGYVHDTNCWIDSFGLYKDTYKKFVNLTDDELLDRIWEFAYRNKRLFRNKGTHGVIHRIREQILGKMRPPNDGWYTHDKEIREVLDNLRGTLDEARKRGLSDVVNSKYPDINNVSQMKPPKPTDTEVPKRCR